MGINTLGNTEKAWCHIVDHEMTRYCMSQIMQWRTYLLPVKQNYPNSKRITNQLMSVYETNCYRFHFSCLFFRIHDRYETSAHHWTPVKPGSIMMIDNQQKLLNNKSTIKVNNFMLQITPYNIPVCQFVYPILLSKALPSENKVISKTGRADYMSSSFDRFW